MEFSRSLSVVSSLAMPTHPARRLYWHTKQLWFPTVAINMAFTKSITLTDISTPLRTLASTSRFFRQTIFSVVPSETNENNLKSAVHSLTYFSKHASKEVKFLMATWFHEMKIPSLLFSLLIEHPSYMAIRGGFRRDDRQGHDTPSMKF